MSSVSVLPAVEEGGVSLLERPVPGPSAIVPNTFEYHRVERPQDLPAADPRAVDVAVLDMNHGWPNLGHDSLVQSVREAAGEVGETLLDAGLTVRAISFDVRRAGGVPEGPGGRFALYLGTGGPGHLDPFQNDGVHEFSQGIRENPSWEAPLYHLFDAILKDDRAALLAVCHTFGVICRFTGVAAPALRGADKGGKSSGVLENVLTAEAEAHPWFGRFTAELAGNQPGRLRILDNRLFDLIPTGGALPAGMTPIGYETLGVGGPPGDAITMIEFARDRAGIMPRVFGVNHHPEILDRDGQLAILAAKLDRGDVSREWIEERYEILTRTYAGEDSDDLLRWTSEATLLDPMRYHLAREVRRRAESFGRAVGPLEDRVVETAPSAPHPTEG
jgi:hypothetical protein